MGNPAYPAGQEGGRPSAASQRPPLSYRRIPVSQLRALPVRHNPRLEVLDYRLTAAPGMADKPRTHGHGAARLPGGFIVSLCVTQDAGQWFLETQALPFDEILDQSGPMDTTAQILADVYRAVQRRQIAAQGKAYGRGKGRN